MSQGLYYGNEWKTADDEPIIVKSRKLSRPEAQRRLNDMFVRREITDQEWRRRTDLLSEVGADGSAICELQSPIRL